MEVKIIAIANHKGGVGKTTTTANLGACLASKGKRVLLIDLDAQCNLTELFAGGQHYDRTIFDALVSGKDLPVIKAVNAANVTNCKKLSLTPASIDLVGIERALAMIVGDSDKELGLLKTLIEPLRGDYDYILIDCPPSLGTLTRSALAASSGVIITLTAESLPTMGMQSLLDGIGRVKAGLNESLKVYGILITRYNRRKLNRIMEAALREQYGAQVFATKIRENVDLMEAPLYRKTIFDYSPSSLGAQDYEALTNEILTIK